MRARMRSLSGRDQAPTTFGAILLRLCDGCGAIAGALADSEGETVDYAGTADPFDIKVAAAELQLIKRLVHAARVPGWSEAREVLVRGSKKSFALVPIVEGYAIILQLLPHAFSVSRRALSEAIRELSNEAGLPIPDGYLDEHWTRVEVRPTTGDERRPAALWVGGQWVPVEVLGRYQDDDLERGELGFRARLTTGAEVNVVREALGRWYVEDLPET